MHNVQDYLRIARFPDVTVHCKKHPGLWHLDVSQPGQFARLERSDIPRFAYCTTSCCFFTLTHTPTGFEATPIAADDMSVDLLCAWLCECTDKPTNEQNARDALDRAWPNTTTAKRNDAARRAAMALDVELLQLPLPTTRDAPQGDPTTPKETS